MPQFMLRSPTLDRVVKSASEFFIATKKRGRNSLADFTIAAPHSSASVFPENLRLQASQTVDNITTNTYYAYINTPVDRKELEFTLSTATPETYCLVAYAANKIVDVEKDANVTLELMTETEYSELPAYKIRMAVFEVTSGSIRIIELTALPVFFTYTRLPLNASESGE